MVLSFPRYADRVKELGLTDSTEDNYKSSPTEKEPDENGTNNVDYSTLSNLNVSPWHQPPHQPLLAGPWICSDVFTIKWGQK